MTWHAGKRVVIVVSATKERDGACNVPCWGLHPAALWAAGHAVVVGVVVGRRRGERRLTHWVSSSVYCLKGVVIVLIMMWPADGALLLSSARNAGWEVHHTPLVHFETSLST